MERSLFLIKRQQQQQRQKSNQQQLQLENFAVPKKEQQANIEFGVL